MGKCSRRSNVPSTWEFHQLRSTTRNSLDTCSSWAGGVPNSAHYTSTSHGLCRPRTGNASRTLGQSTGEDRCDRGVDTEVKHSHPGLGRGSCGMPPVMSEIQGIAVFWSSSPCWHCYCVIILHGGSTDESSQNKNTVHPTRSRV